MKQETYETAYQLYEKLKKVNIALDMLSRLLVKNDITIQSSSTDDVVRLPNDIKDKTITELIKDFEKIQADTQKLIDDL